MEPPMPVCAKDPGGLRSHMFFTIWNYETNRPIENYYKAVYKSVRIKCAFCRVLLQSFACFLYMEVQSSNTYVLHLIIEHLEKPHLHIICKPLKITQNRHPKLGMEAGPLNWQTKINTSFYIYPYTEQFIDFTCSTIQLKFSVILI